MAILMANTTVFIVLNKSAWFTAHAVAMNSKLISVMPYHPEGAFVAATILFYWNMCYCDKIRSFPICDRQGVSKVRSD